MTHSQPKLILASSSERRLSLLAQIGYKPDMTCSPDINEAPSNKELPKRYAERLAIEKVAKVCLERSEINTENHIILGADTVVCVGRRILGKPANEEEARSCIEFLSGRRHRVYTSVCALHAGKRILRTSTTLLKFKRLSEQEIHLFLQSLDWQGKAGGYALQLLAAAFILWIRGSYTGVIGLPLYETYTILTSFGLYPNDKLRSVTA